MEMERILDLEGRPSRTPRLSLEESRALLKAMLFIRTFDSRALTLQRQGRIGTYAPFTGLEGIQAAAALSLSRSDWLVPTYRDTGASILFGLPLVEALAYWKGLPDSYRAPEGVQILPPAVPIATQIPHAVGIGWGLKLQKKEGVVLTFFGDGASSEGDFHEGLNFAGVFKTPVVFLCQNNGWAISVPFHRQTAAESIAVRAQGYGMPGRLIDGNDPLMVAEAVREALERARSGEGPTLIEARTYRVGPHTTSDDPRRYRKEDPAQEALGDPVERLRRYLLREGAWSAEEEEATLAHAREKIAQAVAELEALPRPSPEAIFEHVYGDEPPIFRQQKEAFLQALKEAKA
ncbi:MAG: pyruvate dehydrogenase (acetyl-transferring) E1 component subunit alpha [Clostridiales bacterium]|nr:pyruvate dehydrogenase (acetyl-transferring) E1 component subunit alpha [Clostridiales bacterium]